MNDLLKEAMGQLEDEVVVLALEYVGLRFRRADAFKVKMEAYDVTGHGGPIYTLEGQESIKSLIRGEDIAVILSETGKAEQKFATRFLNMAVHEIERRIELGA